MEHASSISDQYWRWFEAGWSVYLQYLVSIGVGCNLLEFESSIPICIGDGLKLDGACIFNV